MLLLLTVVVAVDVAVAAPRCYRCGLLCYNGLLEEDMLAQKIYQTPVSLHWSKQLDGTTTIENKDSLELAFAVIITIIPGRDFPSENNGQVNFKL